METICYICQSGFLKTSHSNKIFCNFMSNLTKFLNSTNSNSSGTDEIKESIDFKKSSENVFCCYQCSEDIETFCQMWESRELLWSDIIRVVVTVSNLIKSNQTKILPEIVNCFICQSVRKEKKIVEEYSLVVGRLRHFKLCLKRFLSNTKQSLLEKGILKEIAKSDDYCCEKCRPEMETFCEIYEAIDSVQLELFRLLDKIFNNAKMKSDVKSHQNIQLLWQDFVFKVEQRRKLHYPIVTLERLQFPNKADLTGQINFEVNVKSERYVEIKLEPKPPKSEALSSLSSYHSFNHSTDIVSSDIKSEKITMEFEPGFVRKANFKREPEPVADEVWKGVKEKCRRNRKEEKKYHCPFCPSKFAFPSFLEMHMKTHTGEKAYICRICLKEFSECRNFLNHRRKIHHQSIHSNKPPFSCDICEAKFKFKCSLRYRSKHDGKKIHKIHRNKCRICSETFTSYVFLRNHILALHSKESLSYVCKVCRKSVFPNARLKYHVAKVHKKNFKCKLCGQEGLPTIEEWRQHLKTVHPDDSTFKCSYDGCEWTFYTNIKRKQHMLTHSREKPFQCHNCQKSFRVNIYLRRHINNKTCRKSAKPEILKCDHPGCDRVFKSKSNLITHRVYRHSKERNFHCNHCKMSFSTKYDLKIHMYVHKETLPFVCGQCGKGFALRGRLKEHMRTHQK